MSDNDQICGVCGQVIPRDWGGDVCSECLGENPQVAVGMPPDAAEPLKIGDYAVTRKLGRGGMGDVWLAEHPTLGIPLAIKTLPHHLVARDPNFVDRFLQEARTAIKITHPNLVRVYDADSEDDVHFIVMEYIDGETVRDIIKRDRRLPPQEALAIIAAVAEALTAAAECNIVHRDIKLDNIMLDSKGVVKLCDLGLAKQIQGADGEGATMTGATFGTPAYMPPDQARDAKDVDQRADIYSLGATLYHMVTGELPFTGATGMVIVMKHLRDPLPHPTTHVAELPDDVCSLICKMMAKKPEDRYQSARELLDDLRGILAHDTACETQAADAGGGRRSLMTAVLASIAAFVFAFVAVTFLDRPADTSRDTPVPIRTAQATPAVTSERDSTVKKGGLYVAIDISSGPISGNYPIEHLETEPADLQTNPKWKTSTILLRRISAGTFTMGSPAREPGRETSDHRETLHRVTLTKDFYIGVFEVTLKQWELVMGTRATTNRRMRWKHKPQPESAEPRQPALPVDQVKFHDIRGQEEGSAWPAGNGEHKTPSAKRLGSAVAAGQHVLAVSTHTPRPMDSSSGLHLGTLQAWFGQHEQGAGFLRDLLHWAAGTDSVRDAERAAKISALAARDTKTQHTAIELGQRAVEVDKKKKRLVVWDYLALGMAQYRAGNYDEAMVSLAAGGETNFRQTEHDIDLDHRKDTASLYQAMCLIKQDKTSDARRLFLAAETKMKPMPKDAYAVIGKTNADDLVLWMAFREAESMLYPLVRGRQ